MRGREEMKREVQGGRREGKMIEISENKKDKEEDRWRKEEEEK